MQSNEQRDAQTAYLKARARYLDAKIECSNHRMSTWQLQIAREQYVAAIEAFALACGVSVEQDLSAL